MAAETTIRDVIHQVFATEFSDLEFVYRDDKLHESLGDDGRNYLGTSPLRRYPSPDNANARETEVLVQFYLAYSLKVDRQQAVDPSVIEGYVERFEAALKDPSRVASTAVWYFVVDLIEYPEDPTGNITRFEAQVRGIGENSAQI